MANGLQNAEFLIAGIVISTLLAVVISVGFFLSVPSKKSKDCVRSCPFTIWSASNTLLGFLSTFVDILYTAWSFTTIRNTLGGIMLLTASVACYQFHEDVLRNVDDAWRIWLFPLLHDIAEPLILLARFFYNIAAPLYNLYIGIMYQLTRGSAVIVGKCQVEGLYLPLRHFANSTIHMSEAVVDFIADPSRPINITQGSRDALLAVYTAQNGLKCACKQTELVTDVVFYGGNVHAFAFAANSIANIPIQLIRDLVTAVFGGAIAAPTFTHTFAFANDAAIKLGIGMDEWLYYALDKYKILNKTHAPQRSIFSAAAYTAVAAVSIPEDVLSGSLNLLNSPTNEQIRESYSFKTAWIHTDVAAHAVGETLHYWLEHYSVAITREPRKEYDCEWDIDDDSFAQLSITTGCVAEHTLKAFVGIPHVVWSAAMESIFRSYSASDVLSIMQRHDGTWMRRGKGLLSCEYRKEHSLVDGQPPPYLEVDYTTNSEDCVCEVDSFYTDPIQGYQYNPFCKRPNLQSQVFNPADTAVVWASKALFGPLANLANGPPRAFVEGLRIIVRIAFSIPDMIKGQWAQHQLGCGYGVDGGVCNNQFSHFDGIQKCENNANNNCFCDWEKPIDANSNCRCIADYPVFTTTFEETMQVNTAFQKVAPRWCNTMIFEHMLQVVEESGESLSFIFKWLGQEINAAQSLGKQCYHYEVAAMSTTAQLGGLEVNADESATLCSAWGHKNIFCGLGGSATAFTRLVTSTYRQAAVNVIKLLQGDIGNLQLDLSPRLCDAERFVSMMASSLSGSLLFAQFPQREAIGKLLFAIGDGVFVAPLKILHRIYYTIVSILQNIARTGQYDSNQVANTFKALIVDLITTGYDVIKVFLRALEDFFNTLGSGNPKPGRIFKTLRELVEALEEVTTTSYLDVLGEIINIGTQFVSILSGNRDFGGGVVSMLQSVARIISEFVAIVSANISILLNALLSLLGPFGEILKGITGTLCNVVKDIASLPLIGVQNADGVRCFDGGRRLAASIDGNEVTVTTWAHTVLDWNGTSVCDMFMSNTDAPLESLSALEQATWRDCLTKRLLGEKIQEAVDIPELPINDVLYNSLRAPLAAYEVFQNFRVSHGLTRRVDVYNAFLDAHMNPALHMKLYDKMQAFATGAWKAVEMTANDVKAQQMPPSTTKALSKVMTTLQRLNSKEWITDQKAFWTHYKIAKHMLNTTAVSNPFTAVLDQYTVSSTIVDDAVVSGAAIYTDIQGGGPLECTIVDNFFDMLDDHTKSIASFYSHSMPQTIKDFEEYSRRPSFESKLETNDITGATFNALGAEISRWELAGKDWQKLFDGDRLNSSDLQFVIDATSAFLTRTNNSYVPLFGVGLPYVFIYPIFESCDIQQHIFVNETYEFTPSSDERISYVSLGLMNMAIYTIMLQYSSIWSPLPISFLNSTLLLMIVNWFIYAYTVYGYMPSCYPQVPYTLMDDFYGFVKLNTASEHFCSYITLLYPDASACGSEIGDAPVYKSCEDIIPGFEKGAVSEQGDIQLGTIWWPLTTFVRYNIGHVPVVTGFFEIFGELPSDFEKWRSGFEVTPEEVTCMKVMFPAVISTAVAATFLLYVSVKLFLALLRAAINIIVTTFVIYNHTRDVLEGVLDQETEPEVVEATVLKADVKYQNNKKLEW